MRDPAPSLQKLFIFIKTQPVTVLARHQLRHPDPEPVEGAQREVEGSRDTSPYLNSSNLPAHESSCHKILSRPDPPLLL
jgi:hypothetical protein